MELPKRLIDFDALWASDKLFSCDESIRVEYAWLYGLADANGSFELTNLRVIWAKVSAIRPALTVEKLTQIFAEFEARGLLFTWTDSGKKYGHWTKSDIPGRLPRISRRGSRYGALLAPEVPRKLLETFSATLLASHVATSATLDVSQCDASGVVGVALGVALGVGRVRSAESPKNGDSAGPREVKFTYEGKLLSITEGQDKSLADVYPWVRDRQVEYRKADLWRESSWSGKAKNALAFIRNWFNKIPCPSERNYQEGPSAEQIAEGKRKGYL